MDPFFARNRLSAYLDGELPSGEAREVEDALAQSAELRAELEGLRAAISLLRQGGRVPAPKGFAQRLDARIAKEPMRVGWRRHLYGFRIEVGMLAAAAAIVLVFAAQKPDAPAPDDSPGDAPGDPADGSVADAADGSVADAGAGALDILKPPGVDVASVSGLDKPEGPSIAAAPEANGVLGDESFARKAAPAGTPTSTAPQKPRVPSTKGGAKTSYEKEAYAPAWEQTPEVPEPPPTVQSVAAFQFRLRPHGETGLRDLAALAASLGGKLTDARGKELAVYPMESGETRTVKLMLPSVNAGAVASRLAEYGDIEVINVSDRTLYANGATVPVVIEVTAP